ncbi:MAG: hypothetical protein R3A46_06830 [Thermomicrobiales bacterium]
MSASPDWRHLIDGGAEAPLIAVQEMTRRPGQVTMVYVKTRAGVDCRLRERSKQRFPNW